MSLTPSNPRTFGANSSLGLRSTPSNSPYFSRPIRSPIKPQSFFDSGLFLKRIIGTTVSSPTGFDSLPNVRIFAYVAGAAVVVVQIEEDSKYTQRFFRAHPSAVQNLPSNHVSASPGTPVNANDGRNRAVNFLRESSIGIAPSSPKSSKKAWSDSPLSKTWTSRERIKAATCLSLSRDGRFLAVGETGYTPRVLIFNLQESTDVPLVILSEHTFGVTAVAFSPDGRYLATLGTPNDGFLFIWAISVNGAARLHASNKCTSIIRGMTWAGKKLITVGTRHVKIWRVDDKQSTTPAKMKFASDGSPVPAATFPPTVTRMLSGRNCILGVMVDSLFTAVSAISETKAVICTEKGDICVTDGNDGQNQLVKIASTGFSISCVSVDEEKGIVRFGGRCGATKMMKLEELVLPSTPPASPCEEDFDTPELLSPNGTICAMAVVDGYVVTADTRHAIKITKKDESMTSAPAVPYTAHCDPVMGVRLLSKPNKYDADFFSFDSAGKVLFWDLEGHCKGTFITELEQADGGGEDVENQCLIVRASACGTFFVAGDKYGVLRVISSPENTCTFMAKAHNSDIEDIAIHEGKDMTLIATCGRDRTIQLFKKNGDDWLLVQTMDEHTGSVGSICFSDDGEKIITSSSDRTIQIRQLVVRDVLGDQIIAAIPTRVITVKGTPVAMALSTNDACTSLLMVSMMDRTVATFEIATGKMISSFKATDGEGNDAVVMSTIVMGRPAPGKPLILAGVSGTDKSVRIYDGKTGCFLDRGFGHTASVTDVCLLETAEQTMLISTGSDSTIMIWDLTTKTPEVVLPAEPIVTDPVDTTPAKELTSNMPPLRRVLSKAELAEFQRNTPIGTPTGRGSPPRVIRKDTSKHNLTNNINTNSSSFNKLGVPPISSMPHHHGSYSDEINGASSSKRSARTRSRSPPPSPKSKQRSRESLGLRKGSCIDLRGRTKSNAGMNTQSEFGSLNNTTEQVCRTLRAYRNKINSTENVRDELEKELVRELQLTAQAIEKRRERESLVLRERDASKGRKISDTVLVGLLDQYSERLVRVFDEKLRLSMMAATPERAQSEAAEERPRSQPPLPTLLSPIAPTPSTPSVSHSAPASRVGSLSKASGVSLAPSPTDIGGEPCKDGDSLMPLGAPIVAGMRRKSRTG